MYSLIITPSNDNTSETYVFTAYDEALSAYRDICDDCLLSRLKVELRDEATDRMIMQSVIFPLSSKEKQVICSMKPHDQYETCSCLTDMVSKTSDPYERNGMLNLRLKLAHLSPTKFSELQSLLTP